MDTEDQQKSNQKKSVDFIIVGQGIAGSCMAITLIKSGYSVCVINNSTLSTCSQVAAGIWNPIVFKRLTKSWLIDEAFPDLISFYNDCEQLFDSKIVYHRQIIKPFTEEQEKVLWEKKVESVNNPISYLDSNIYHDLKIDENHAVKTYSKVLNAGNIDVSKFLNQTENYILKQQYYLSETVDFNLVSILPNEVTYKNITAKNIIFCEGHLISNNPFFNWIPLKPAKGEVLTIHSEHILLENDIYNKGFFVLPLGNNLYKVGATYQWDVLNDAPTDAAKQELIRKINSVITTPFKIINHQAGVRPSVTDRRPVIGNHPLHQNAFVFNGFGTKAVMLAPYFANHLISFITNNTPINPEVTANRFYK